MLNDNEIHSIDLTKALIQADRKTRMYNLYDIYFTTEGNQIAADTSTPIIQKIRDDSLMRENERHIPNRDAQSVRRVS